MKFAKAERHKARLRLGITGPSGSGKTWGALMVAKGLGGKIAVIDTERGSASLYTHLADFDVLELTPPYTPERFIEAIKAAEGGGYDILIIDSTTPEWNGIGGCLELVDEIGRSRFQGNVWSAWSVVTPRHRAFIDTMIASRLHVIATMRSKTETAQVDDARGKKKVVKLGMKAEQRDGIEYELTTVLDLTHEGHYAAASKDRTGLFAGDPQPLSAATGARLLAWLDNGAEMVAAPVPQAPAAVAVESDGRPPPRYTKAGRTVTKEEAGGRMNSASAKERGEDEIIRKAINACDLAGIVEWEDPETFEARTSHIPFAWLDSVRDNISAQKEALLREAEVAFRTESKDAVAGRVSDMDPAGEDYLTRQFKASVAYEAAKAVA